MLVTKKRQAESHTSRNGQVKHRHNQRPANPFHPPHNMYYDFTISTAHDKVLSILVLSLYEQIAPSINVLQNLNEHSFPNEAMYTNETTFLILENLQNVQCSWSIEYYQNCTGRSSANRGPLSFVRKATQRFTKYFHTTKISPNQHIGDRKMCHYSREKLQTQLHGL